MVHVCLFWVKKMSLNLLKTEFLRCLPAFKSWPCQRKKTCLLFIRNLFHASTQSKPTLWVLNFSEGTKYIFTVYVIPSHWHDTGRWNYSSSKTKTYLLYIVNIMGVDALVMQGARASAIMIFTKFVCQPQRMGHEQHLNLRWIWMEQFLYLVFKTCNIPSPKHFSGGSPEFPFPAQEELVLVRPHVISKKIAKINPLSRQLAACRQRIQTLQREVRYMWLACE